MARMLIVGGGCRARTLAAELVAEGHAVRITTRNENGCAAIEAVGAECWVGTPDRLATLRGALENVTFLFWLLGGAHGSEDELRELHGPRLEFFLTQAIDTTVRGFVYEARGSSTPADVLAEGELTVRRLTQRNVIPVAFLTADPNQLEDWLGDARMAVRTLLDGG